MSEKLLPPEQSIYFCLALQMALLGFNPQRNISMKLLPPLCRSRESNSLQQACSNLRASEPCQLPLSSTCTRMIPTSHLIPTNVFVFVFSHYYFCVRSTDGSAKIDFFLSLSLPDLVIIPVHVRDREVRKKKKKKKAQKETTLP